MDNKIKMLTAILEAFEDGIYVMNQDLTVEYMNSAMIAEFGDGIGRKCHQLLNQTEDKCPWCRSMKVSDGLLNITGLDIGCGLGESTVRFAIQ